MSKLETTLILAVLSLAVIACAGSSARMTQIHVDEQLTNQPVTNVLIIVMIDDQEIRAIFETYFKDWLKVKGVESIVSADLLAIDSDTPQEKDAIREVVDKHENDAILVTRLVGYRDTEVFSRGRPNYFYTYHGFYNYGLLYVAWPTVSGEKVRINLETALYDVETESPIWAGESQLKNPKTTGQAIGQVAALVIEELERNGLVPGAP